MNRAKVPRQTAKKISGHKTDAIYNRYDIVDEDDIEAGVLLTQQYLDGDNTVTAIPDGGSTEKDPMRLYNLLKKVGGSVWESNPPSRVLAPITGFEVQAAHQHRYASTITFQGLARQRMEPHGLLLGKLMGLDWQFDPTRRLLNAYAQEQGAHTVGSC
jgi:hypothetical protein